MPTWPSFSGLDKRRALRVAMTLCIGLVGAALYSQTPMPLPWFLGSMTRLSKLASF